MSMLPVLTSGRTMTIKKKSLVLSNELINVELPP